MILYCDSSAVAKIYLEERGSAYMKNVYRALPIGDLVTSNIAGPEVLSALNRRFRNDDLTAELFFKARKDFLEDYAKFFSRLSVSEPVVERAMQLVDKHGLRGYDSVHLGTALYLQNVLRSFNGREVIFVSSDKALNAAAAVEGLTVINPAGQE